MSPSEKANSKRSIATRWKRKSAKTIVGLIICGGAFTHVGTVSVSAEPVHARVRDKDQMTMVLIPRGDFRIGSTAGEADEQPVHQIYLDAFWMDQTEITNAEYKKCATSGFCTNPSREDSFTRQRYYSSEDEQYTDFPVVHVNWYQAEEYCKWAGGRLPTEAEWEAAARGTDGRTYPMGDTVDKESANYAGFVGDTTRSGSYPSGSSPYGVLDMAGNVWEWMSDWYDQDFYRRSPNRNPTGSPSGLFRVLRGGSWEDDTDQLRSANRNWNDPLISTTTWGFRCVVPE